MTEVAPAEDTWMRRRFLKNVVMGCAVATMFGTGSAPAQEAGALQIGAQIPVSHFGELDSNDVGIGGRASWRLSRWIGVEGELNVYPGDIPKRLAVSRNRLEGLAGITAGVNMNGWRPFVRLRPGFLRVASSPGPLVCTLIFPPSASCSLAAGETLLAFDLGAGIEVRTPGRTFVRFDVGDMLLRFPGPARDRDNQVHDGNYVRHQVRVATGAGWRF